MKPRIKLSTTQPLRRSEVYSYLISDIDGAGLSQKDIAHLTGLLPRDVKRYSCAEPEDIEDNLARATLARAVNVFPELYEYLKYPTFDDVWLTLKTYFPEITGGDVAVLLGATRQNAKRWISLEGVSPKSPVFLRNARAILMIVSRFGLAGAEYWVGSSLREQRLLGVQSEFSDYLLQTASDILETDRFQQFEESRFSLPTEGDEVD